MLPISYHHCLSYSVGTVASESWLGLVSNRRVVDVLLDMSRFINCIWPLQQQHICLLINLVGHLLDQVMIVFNTPLAAWNRQVQGLSHMSFRSSYHGPKIHSFFLSPGSLPQRIGEPPASLQWPRICFSEGINFIASFEWLPLDSCTTAFPGSWILLQNSSSSEVVSPGLPVKPRCLTSSRVVIERLSILLFLPLPPSIDFFYSPHCINQTFLNKK